MSAMDSAASKMIDEMKDVDSLISFAKTAESSERYDDMARAMNRVTRLKGSLDETCRNLLSVAYKNVVGARRSSWRVVCAIELKGDSKKRMELVQTFKTKVEGELDDTCKEVLDLLHDHLIKAECSSEETVFYLKMRGDYWRYIAEYKPDLGPDCERAKAIESAEEAYKKALEHAQANMKSTHPNRLGLALNFSVFYYEILNSPEKACTLAKEAFDMAISELDNVPKDECKDSTLILQLLRDNLTLWTSDSNNDNGED